MYEYRRIRDADNCCCKSVINIWSLACALHHASSYYSVKWVTFCVTSVPDAVLGLTRNAYVSIVLYGTLRPHLGNRTVGATGLMTYVHYISSYEGKVVVNPVILYPSPGGGPRRCSFPPLVSESPCSPSSQAGGIAVHHSREHYT
jgi:hypothetical protein